MKEADVRLSKPASLGHSVSRRQLPSGVGKPGLVSTFGWELPCETIAPGS